MPNQNKIAFIICYNNEQMMDECEYYINHLIVPDSCITEIIKIRDAKSLTQGYNLAMKKTDAKYKIYLHQDMMLINPNLLNELVEIFKDESIGMIGTLGMDRLFPDADMHTYWNSGKTLNQTYQEIVSFDFMADCTTSVQEVAAIDGMFMATQYDIEWDEAITGWHMYDLSQCVRFLEKGYRICLPNTCEFWTLHDSGFCSNLNYDKARKLLCDHYPQFFIYSTVDRDVELSNMDEILIAEIQSNIANAEMNQYGSSKIKEMSQDVFYPFYCEIKHYLRRMEFNMPKEDWESLILYIRYNKISIAFLMEALQRCTMNPEKIIGMIEECLS